ncbi:putative acyl-CoA dehydrogenase [Actinacidiphila reveromycinica]|uniref:Putative acyl-CoA dehydrogenase n=1 Tax=Actinacidiphila reveromycinica TaxID=659352 RepID=A0A7U3UQ61_9ACTN|nr:acyl-CoA dehydrogenase family protein [Streptomyces sp. SN-593]BBA96689.1 putative acyl-CoA dehydrogenase [Streptomyces sp. SN-593]
MIEFGTRLHAIRDAAREAAEDLRARALSVDADPDAMEAHFDSPTFALMRRAGTPEPYRETVPGLGDGLLDEDSCLENVVGTLELARGDAGMILACPGPALAGVVVRMLGDEQQQERFFTKLHGGRTHTFFAMTEPGRGNDATAMETRLERDGDGWRLYGHKRYIGNGARGGIGVVFARTGPSALSIRAALVEPGGPGWQGERLDMVGLRGAYLSELRFDGVPVAGDMLLGRHLPVTRRGMWGAIKTFHNMRIQVAAAAVGTALAMTEYVVEHRKNAPGAQVALHRTEAARELVYEAAARIDRDPERGYLSNVAKLAATRMAVEISHWACASLGPAGLLEHPLLEKWSRDVCAFEFMEGTGNIQRLHVAKGYLAGDADA